MLPAFRLFLATAAVGAVAASQADAAAIVVGNAGNSNANVLFHGTGTVDAGLTVIGAIQNDGMLVRFVSDTSLETQANGQAYIRAAAPASGFDDLLIEPVDPASTAISSLVFKVEGQTAGTLTITGNLIGGGSFSESFFVPVHGGGSGFFTVMSDTGMPLSSVSLTSTGLLSSIRQVRLNLADVTVPEPTFGAAGLAALALMAKRRR